MGYARERRHWEREMNMILFILLTEAKAAPEKSELNFIVSKAKRIESRLLWVSGQSPGKTISPPNSGETRDQEEKLFA